MPDANKRRLAVTTAVFWVLFLYIIAALLWWFFSLMQQAQAVHNLRRLELEQSAYSTTSPAYKNAIAEIDEQRRRSTYKYIGEGSVFLLLIIVGAIYIYRSVRRQLQLQKQQKLVDTSLQETLRLDMLINNILISSQLDGKGYHTQKEALDFSALAMNEVKSFSSRYPDRPVHTRIEPDVELVGDALLLKLLISNLLENANKYSAKGKPIYAALQKSKGILLQVRDEGPGIADSEKEKVFQKFYRIGNEQTRTAKGTGLGLFICKKIATMHGAGIQVSDNIPQGAVFAVQFPA